MCTVLSIVPNNSSNYDDDGDDDDDDDFCCDNCMIINSVYACYKEALASEVLMNYRYNYE